jgi:hypothetical protein
MPLIRALHLGLWSGALLLHATPATSDPSRVKERRACVSAYERGQELEHSVNLRLARDVLLTCARSVCGSFIQRECSTRYNELESEIPTVILVARDDDAEPLVDVQVTVDGLLLTAKLDGRPPPSIQARLSFRIDNGASSPTSAHRARQQTHNLGALHAGQRRRGDRAP